ncbi:MAG: MurR/RpiR family transcriptional regulator [Faecalibacillus sp.]
MNNILDKLVKEHKLNANEKEICQYMVENIDNIPFISSREFARRTYTNSTSILRFVKKIGFKNYNDFKVNITSYLKSLDLHNNIILSQEDLLTLTNKMADIEKSVIDRTKEMLSMKTLEQIVNELDKVKYIDIIANDANSNIAEYASHNFCFVGKIVTVYTNVDKQLYLGLNADKNHVVIIMSKYSSTKNLLNTALTLKSRNITTIAICSSKESSLSKRCTYTLIGVFGDSFKNLKDLVFNISSKYLFDLLFVALFSKTYNQTLELEQMHSHLYQRRL